MATVDSGSKSKSQEGGNKGRAKIKRGRTKRKGFLLHNLGDAFRWNPDANLPKNLKQEVGKLGTEKWFGLAHGIGWGDFSKTKHAHV